MKKTALVVGGVLVMASVAQALTATPVSRATPTGIGDLGYSAIHGVVADAASGAPIAGASVSVRHVSFFPRNDEDRVTVTDTDGRYRLRVFLHDTDTFTVTASAMGFAVLHIDQTALGLWRNPRVEFRLRAVVTVTPSPTVAPSATPMTPGADAPSCIGDCDGNRTITVDEIVSLVEITAGRVDSVACWFPGDHNRESVPGDLVDAVRNALTRCEMCGDPAAISRFSSCTRSSTETACVSAGGVWGRYPFSGRPGCFCPTGQEGCPCRSASDCLGKCSSPISRFPDCEDATSGICSTREPEGGCWCAFNSVGGVSGLCVDP